MMEDDTTSKFNGHLRDIVNEAFALGEDYFVIKLVKKVLRS